MEDGKQMAEVLIHNVAYPLKMSLFRSRDETQQQSLVLSLIWILSMGFSSMVTKTLTMNLLVLIRALKSICSKHKLIW